MLADITLFMTLSALSVLSYNMHKGFSVGNRRFVLPEIRLALHKVNADLVFLQEIQGQHLQNARQIAGWPELSQIEYLAKDRWPYHAYAKNAVYEHGHHGNAILSKYPFVSWENLNVSPFSWASRSVLHASIQLPGLSNPVHIICIHFGLLARERRRQMAMLCRRINSHVPRDAVLIIAGDFNDWSEQANRQFHHSLGLREVFQVMQGSHVQSFPVWLPIFRMDRIYYRGLKPIDCAGLTASPWRLLSDHAALTANFSLTSN